MYKLCRPEFISALSFLWFSKEEIRNTRPAMWQPCVCEEQDLAAVGVKPGEAGDPGGGQAKLSCFAEHQWFQLSI